MAKIYPIGVQNFAELREGGYIYVDKTGFIDKLIKSGKYFFLSRPRRFGKSLLLSTIEAFYQGRKDLFDGLAISRSGYDWRPYPVFHFDLTGKNYCDEHALIRNIDEHLREWEERYRPESIAIDPDERFRNVIKAAKEATGRKAVILIDEYDKPLLDTAADKDLQNIYRGQLKALYGNLKRMDAYIEFAMLTGVTKFGRLSVFSDLNNLKDISLRHEFSAICGITETEITTYFKNGVQEFAENNRITDTQAYDMLKKNYDGYHFCGDSPDIYNPYSLLCALDAREIGSYWFATGTPTFLVEMIKRDNLPLKDLNNYETEITSLENLPDDLQNPIPVLYQSGYLTIRSYDPEFRNVTLGYPNREVEQGFLKSLLPYYTPVTTEFNISNFVKDVRSGNVDGFMTRLQALFSDYKYSQVDFGHLELHYRNVIYLVARLMGFYTEAEMQTAAGRIDLMIKTADYIYIFEFKLNRSAREAIRQIDKRDYLLPFKADGRKIIKVGANFDDSIRSISTPWIVQSLFKN